MKDRHAQTLDRFTENRYQTGPMSEQILTPKFSKAHKSHTKTFGELTFGEQAKSLNAAMAWCSKAVNAHILKANEERGQDAAATAQKKCIGQLVRLLARVENL